MLRNFSCLFMPRITITVPNQSAQPYRFSLERQIVHFGRGDDNDVHIDSGSVSSEHCVMERTIGGYVLKDLSSTNGIKLNGKRVDEISLRNGQSIEIGDVDFGFVLNDEEINALRLEDPTSSLPPLSADSNTNSPEPEKNKEPSAAKIKGESENEIELLSDPKSQTQPRQKPLNQAGPQHISALSAAAAPAKSNFNTWVSIIAVIAFVVGIAMHYQRSTGESFLSAVIQKLSGESAE